MTYKFYLPHTSNIDILIWCEENCKNYDIEYRIINEVLCGSVDQIIKFPDYIIFDNNEDAIVFKLKFGDICNPMT